MPVGAVGSAGGWPVVAEAADAGAGIPGGAPMPDDAAGCAERAMELVLQGQSDFATTDLHGLTDPKIIF